MAEKFAVVSVVNGNFFIDSEWTDNVNGAINAWHDRCRALRSASDVNRAVVKILTSDLLTYDKYEETIGEAVEPTFAIISCVNGNFLLDSEWGSNLEGAIIAWHERCKVLWSAKDVARAVVRLMNSDLTTYTKYEEYVGHEVVVNPEPEV